MLRLKRFHSFVLFVFTVMLLCVSVTGACQTFSGRDAAAVLARYCKFDFDGARLSSESWTRLEDLIAWEDEPGWDAMIVVKDYRFGTPRVTESYAEIAVTYDVLGRYSGEAFTPQKKSETILFKIQRTETTWRIVEPKIPPHVSRAKTIETVLALAKDARGDHTRSNALQIVIQQLQNQ